MPVGLALVVLKTVEQEGWMELGPVVEVVGKEGAAEDVGYGIELVK